MTIPICDCMCDACLDAECTACIYLIDEPSFREVHPVTNAEDEAALAAVVQPWTNVPASWIGSIPQWIIDQYRVDEPKITADEIIAGWIENMEANAYDIARETGTYPT